MPQVAGDEFQSMLDSRRSNLQIRIRKDDTRFLQVCSDLPEDPCGGRVIREHVHCRKDTVRVTVKVMIAGCGAIRALVEFSNDNRAGKLILPGNDLDPAHIGGEWPNP